MTHTSKFADVTNKAMKMNVVNNHSRNLLVPKSLSSSEVDSVTPLESISLANVINVLRLVS
jgi:hypothetical protein